MNRIAIYTTQEVYKNENMQTEKVTLYNAREKGTYYLTIFGEDIEVIDLGYNSDGIRINGGSYAIRDAINFARNGEHGLTINHC